MLAQMNIFEILNEAVHQDSNKKYVQESHFIPRLWNPNFSHFLKSESKQIGDELGETEFVEWQYARCEEFKKIKGINNGERNYYDSDYHKEESQYIRNYARRSKGGKSCSCY